MNCLAFYILTRVCPRVYAINSKDFINSRYVYCDVEVKKVLQYQLTERLAFYVYQQASDQNRYRCRDAFTLFCAFIFCPTRTQNKNQCARDMQFISARTQIDTDYLHTSLCLIHSKYRTKSWNDHFTRGLGEWRVQLKELGSSYWIRYCYHDKLFLDPCKWTITF